MQIFKEATIKESGLLTSLVKRAKAQWGYPREWLEEWKEELTISPNYIESNIVVKFESDNNLIGFYGLELKDKFAYLGHLWVDPLHIGAGYGKLLFTKACEESLNSGHSIMELVADPNAEGFYRHLGAEKIDDIRGSIFGTPRVLPRMRVNLKNTNEAVHATNT